MWRALLLICALAFVVALGASVLNRLRAGATWAHLARTRCADVATVRGVLWALFGVAFSACLLDGLLFGWGLLVVWAGRREFGNYLVLAVTALLMAPLVLLYRKVYAWFIAVPERENPAVHVDGAPEHVAASPEGLAGAGVEGFSEEGGKDNLLRWAVLLASVLLAGLVGLHLAWGYEGRPFPHIELEPVTPPQGLSLLGLYVSGMVLVALLTGNQGYKVLPLRPALALRALLALLVAAFAHGWLGEPRVTEVALAVCVCASGYRTYRELARGTRVRQSAAETAPFAGELRTRLPYLNRLARWADSLLPPLRAPNWKRESPPLASR